MQVHFDSNKWCVPAAISAVTGIKTSEAARAICKVRGSRSVNGGVNKTHHNQALEMLGFSTHAVPVDWFSRVVRNNSLKDTRHRKGNVYWVSVTRDGGESWHAVVIQGDTWWDNGCWGSRTGEPLTTLKFDKMREVFEVSGKLNEAAIEDLRAEKRTKRQRVKTLVRQMKLEMVTIGNSVCIQTKQGFCFHGGSMDGGHYIESSWGGTHSKHRTARAMWEQVYSDLTNTGVRICSCC